MPPSDKTHKTRQRRSRSFEAESKGDIPKDLLTDPNGRSLEAHPGVDGSLELSDAHAKELKGTSDKSTRRRSVKELKGMLGTNIKHVSIEEMNAAIEECASLASMRGPTKKGGNDET